MIVFGLVIFTLQNGNLRGRWMDTSVPAFEAENAVRNSGDTGFIGTYNSTWTDSAGDFAARLVITGNVNDNRFILNWTAITGANGLIRTTYTGIGTEINGELVCSYLMRP